LGAARAPDVQPDAGEAGLGQHEVLAAILQRPQIVLAVGDVLEDGAETAGPVGPVDVGREMHAVAHPDPDVAFDHDPPSGRLEMHHTPRRGIRSFQWRSAKGAPSAPTSSRMSTRNSSAVASKRVSART